MRIVHVSDFYPPRVGGVEQQVFQLAHAQAAAGHEVHVVTATTEADPRQDPDDTVRVHRVPPGGREHVGILAGPGALRAVGPVVTGLAPDVVHAHSSVLSPFALAGAAAASRAGTPAVVTVHSMWARLATPYRIAFARTGLVRLPIHWTAVSAIAAAQVQEAVGRAVEVIPNGIDADTWAPADRPSVQPVHIVSVLRFAPRKRPLALLRALRRARAAIPPDVEVHATIAGRGPLRLVGRAYLRRHAMTWVSLPGVLARSEVRTLLGSASMFVSAARLESFGIAALEARCAGVPVVALGRTGIADFVEHDVEGLVVDDDRALADAVAALAPPTGIRKSITDYVREVRPAVGWPATLAAAERAYAVAARTARAAS